MVPHLIPAALSTTFSDTTRSSEEWSHLFLANQNRNYRSVLRPRSDREPITRAIAFCITTNRISRNIFDTISRSLDKIECSSRITPEKVYRLDILIASCSLKKPCSSHVIWVIYDDFYKKNNNKTKLTLQRLEQTSWQGGTFIDLFFICSFCLCIWKWGHDRTRQES